MRLLKRRGDLRCVQYVMDDTREVTDDSFSIREPLIQFEFGVVKTIMTK